MAKAKFFSMAIAMALVLSLGLAALAPGEVLANPPYWAKTYGGADGDFAYSIQETSDGGYIVAGEAGSFGAGGYDVWGLKLDSAGNVAWQKTYGGTYSDFAYSIQETSDGGYIVAGETWSFGAGGYDVWVLKLEADGNVTWQKTCGGAENDAAYSIQETSDGGYIVAGETWSFGAGSCDVWVLKLEANGNVTWQKTYGGASDDFAYSIQETSDGGYIVAGNTESFGAGSCDIWILKLDSAGNVTWQKTYGGQYIDGVRSIQETSDGGYIVAGETDLSGAGSADVWILKIEADGNVTWQKTYGGADDDSAYSIQETSDGGYIVAGRTESFGAGVADVWVLKIEANGNVAWQKTYGGASGDYAYSIQETSGGGYIVAGRTESFGAGLTDVWVLKLDSDGSIPGCPLGVASDAAITVTTVTGETTTADVAETTVTPAATGVMPWDSDCTIDTQCSYSPHAPAPTGVPTLNQWGIVAMITLFAGLLAWTVRRRRLAS